MTTEDAEFRTRKTNLFYAIERARVTGGDWCTPIRAHTLASLVLAMRPRVIVEIGVWGGSTCIPMALAARDLGMWTDATTGGPAVSKVIAIDPWDPTASVKGQDEINAAWWADKERHEWAYETFIEQIAEHDLTNIEVYRMRSDAAPVPALIGLLHIDGNHGEQAINDVLRFSPAVRPGGIVVLDDYHWSSGTVKMAGEVLESTGFRALYEIDQKSYGRVYQRVGMA